jgi:glutamyl-Q tRNA(Asp) synthetase
VAHAAAGAAGGAFRLRIDDIDQGRSRPEWRAGIDDDLSWLGLAVDGPVVVQSERMMHYVAARDRLRDAGLLYPCFCTRADIAAEVTASASAPHGPDGPVYPGICKGRDAEGAAELLAIGKAAAWRLDMAEAVRRCGDLYWWDRDAGTITARPLSAGDVVLWRRPAGKDAGGPAYHLASTVDDADMGIDLVVRGRDLFAATDIHRLLQALLDVPVPAYHHHRLVAGAEGRRLAKRDDAASLAGMRAAGVDGAQLAELLRTNALPLPYRWMDT